MSEIKPATQPDSQISLNTGSGFAQMQRVAHAFSESQLVPRMYQKNLPNVILALEMAQRIGCSPLMVMQNLNIIHEKPSFGASFMIATVNACGKFSPLRFIYVGTRDQDDWGCYAVAKSKIDDFECKSVIITLGMAKAEGWVKKAGSKWQTMPELMLQYRAATFWTRAYAPELLMGFPTQDEIVDIHDGEPKVVTPIKDEDQALAAGVAPTTTVPKVEKRARKGISSMPAETVIPPAQAEAPPEKPAEKKEEPAKPISQESSSSSTESAAAPEAPASAASPEPDPAPVPKETSPAPAQEAPVESAAEADAAMLPRVELVATRDIGSGVTELNVKGDITGMVYWRAVPGKTIPAIGAIMDVAIEDRPSKNNPARIMKLVTQFEVVA